MPVGEYVNLDLETTMLEIKTNSQLGSGDELDVRFYTPQKREAGGFVIKLLSSPKRKLASCRWAWEGFSASLPDATDKVFQIIVTKSPEIRLRILCNNKEVFNKLMSTCDDGAWQERWVSRRDVAKIQFHSLFTASDFYRAIGNYHSI